VLGSIKIVYAAHSGLCPTPTLILNDLPQFDECRFIVPEINLKPDTVGTLDDGLQESGELV
jgi:hypothetical protein